METTQIRKIRELERDAIIDALHALGGHRTQAAAALGISLRTLRNKIREYRREGAEIPASRWQAQGRAKTLKEERPSSCEQCGGCDLSSRGGGTPDAI